MRLGLNRPPGFARRRKTESPSLVLITDSTARLPRHDPENPGRTSVTGIFRVRHGACARGRVRVRAFACWREHLAHCGIAAQDRRRSLSAPPPPIGGMATGRASPWRRAVRVARASQTRPHRTSGCVRVQGHARAYNGMVMSLHCITRRLEKRRAELCGGGRVCFEDEVNQQPLRHRRTLSAHRDRSTVAPILGL